MDGQFALLEDRVSPASVELAARQDAEEVARTVASNELHDFRSTWGRASDYRFDCALQCLHVLYSRAGIPTEGALASLQRSLCAADVEEAFPPLPKSPCQ